MFKSLIMRIAKSYILGSVNEFLLENKDNAKKVAEQVGIWTTRMNMIMSILNQLAKYVQDGKLDENEARSMMELLDNTIKDFH